MRCASPSPRLTGRACGTGSLDNRPSFYAPCRIGVHIASQPASVPPGGAGETLLPPFAPVLGNAIFATTGRRVGRLPIGHQLAA